MSKSQSVTERVDAIKASCDSKLRIVSRTLPAAIAKKDAALAHENVRAGASSLLRAAMIYARHDKDFVTARQYCLQCAQYADTLTEMARLGLEGTPWSGLYVLYCSLFAGAFEKADEVARWISRCAVAEDDADPHDPLAMLSAYGVLDQLERFEVCRRDRFDTTWHATHPFFGPLSVYFDVWHALLKRDQIAFDRAMLLREEHQVRLSKQRGEGRLEFGGGDDSKYIIDFMGVGCAITARRRGMSCDMDTIYLPKAMVDLAMEPAV